MTTLFLNPTELEKKIKELRSFADSAEDRKGEISGESGLLGEPMNGDGMTVFVTAVVNRVATLRARADSIESCKNKIVEISSDGVGSMDADGNVTLEIPGELGVDSPEELAGWCTAARDAHDLESISGSGLADPLPSGRTYDELLESIKENKGNTTYADSLIEEVGPENLTQIPMDVDARFRIKERGYGEEISVRSGAGEEMAGLLGEVLATASTTWDAERSEEVAGAVVGSVDEQGEWGHIAVLNAMIGGHDSNNDHVNDLRFGNKFLVSLGEGLEEIPWDQISTDVGLSRSAYDDAGKRAANGGVRSSFEGYSLDPLAGVLDAMGNNPDAALDFLASPGYVPDGSHVGGDMTRLHELSQRSWDESGMAGFAGAIAAGSSKRNSERPGEAERADDLSGHALLYLSEYTEESDYNDTAEARIGLLLANCAPEIQGVALDSGPSNSDTGRKLPAATSESIETLLYRVVDNEDAAATISAAVAEHTRSRSAVGAQANEGNSDGQIGAIDAAYSEGVQTVGYLAGMADSKAGFKNADIKGDTDANTASARTAIQIFNTVATAGLGAVGGPVGAAAGSTAGRVATSVATTLLTPILADATVPNAEDMESTMPTDADNGVWAAAVRDAANAGLISQEDLKGASRYTWVVQDDDGSYRIDLTGADDSDFEDLTSWTRNINSPISSDETIQILKDDFPGNYAGGRYEGAEAAGAARKREG